MAEDIKKLDKYLSCDTESLPNAIKKILSLHPRSTSTLALLRKNLQARNLEAPILFKCVRTATERTFIDYPEPETGRDDKKPLLINQIIHLVYLLVEKEVPLEDASKLFRLLNSILPVPTEEWQLKILSYISTTCIRKSGSKLNLPLVQEMVLWLMWFRAQKEEKTGPPPVWVLVKCQNLDCDLLKNWSAALQCVGTRLGCRLIGYLIKFMAPSTTVDVCDILANFRLNFPLKAAVRSLGERRVIAGFEAAKADGLDREYLAILDVICLHYLTVIEAHKEREKLCRMIEVILPTLECFVADTKSSVENILLLLRHLIFNRKVLTDGEFQNLCEQILRLREVLPFGDKDHIVWQKDSIAKFANAVIPMIRDCKNRAHGTAMMDVIVGIMKARLSVAPSSKDSLQLLRTIVSFSEISLNTELDKNRPHAFLSPPSILELLEVFGPDDIHPMLLMACLGIMKQHGSFLCDVIGDGDPNKPKWLALELYALHRMDEADSSIENVRNRLREFAKDEHISVIISISELRSMAQKENTIGDNSSKVDDNVLLESARRNILFSLRYKQLSKSVADELEQFRQLSKGKPKTGHEKLEQLDRAELCTDLPVALEALCCGNFIDLFRNLRWTLDNHKRLKGIPYWVLLSTFVFDDFRTAAAFYAMNGDFRNQLKALSCLQLILSTSNAPKSMTVDYKLKMAEALIFAGCLENARAILEKLEAQIKDLPLYSEDFFFFENKLERLRMCLLVEGNGPNRPDDMTVLATPVRYPTLDKLRIYAVSRYFQGKAIHQWNMAVTGHLVASDCLESCTRNLASSLHKMRRKPSTTWEFFEVSHLLLMSETLRADLAFERGAMRDTVSYTYEVGIECQRVISFYFLLIQLERLIRMSLRLELSLDSKMSLVGDLIDPKRTEVPPKDPPLKADAEESFDLRKTDTIPYRTALFLKMKQHQIDVAKRRVPAKEFLKFNKRRAHSRECKCPMCSSIGIDLTIRRIDAVTSFVTKEKFVPLEGSVFEHLRNALRGVAAVNNNEVRCERGCEQTVLDIQITHAFYLAHGHAAEGNFHVALDVLEELRKLVLKPEDALEYHLRKFEYTYQIDWQIALKALEVHTNSPVETSRPFNSGDTFKTPAMVRKREVTNIQARRKVRIPFPDCDSGASSDGDDAPAKKIPKKADLDAPVDKLEKSRPIKTKAKKTAPTQVASGSNKPKFVPLDEFSGITTRRRKKLLELPRFETASKDIGSVDELFDDEDEISFVETFSRMNFRDRLKKPKQISQSAADEEFQILLRAARECKTLARQGLVTDLFQFLAFLSAIQKKRLEFAFYLERSIGIAVQLAALNRGSKMAEYFDEEVLASDYFGVLRPTIDFDPNWHERIWEWCDPEWVIVQLSTIMEGGATPGILVTRYESHHPPALVHLSAKHDAQFQGSLLKHFDNLQLLNSISLHQPRNYWKNRHDGDELLHEFCSSLENSWMACWKGLFRAGVDGPEKQIIEDVFLRTIDFAGSHGFHPDERMLSIGLQGVDALKPDQLTAMLCKTLGARSSEDIGRVQEFAESLISTEEREKLTKARRKPVILVLDRLLINLPIESCPMFREAPVTRMPSVPFTVAHALFQRKRKTEEKTDPFVLGDPWSGFYVVNPGKDLPGTEERFFQHMKSVVGIWEGVCGEPLSRENFRKFLQSKSVYLYSGHGGGRQFMKEHIELINVRAVALLFGCSSGRMRRVGSKMDTEGYALRFLMGGAPAVVGSLWDVTDRDIDAFTYSVLHMWLHTIFPPGSSPMEPQLGAAVNKSRGACKLKALVGAAPVVFGLPCASSTL